MFASTAVAFRRLLAVLVLISAVATGSLMETGTAYADTTDTLAPGTPGFSPGAGLLWESDADLGRDLDLMTAVGARWVRLDFDWASVEDRQGSYDWTNLDRVVGAARSRGLQVLALPAYTPAWARPSGTTSHTAPTDPAAYAAFVGAAAARYAPQGVTSYEIWNEPNLAMFWAPRPDPAAYARLLIAAAAAVHAAAPGATVLSGGLAPATDAADGSEIRPATFLAALYAAGAGPSFDAVAVHPYSFPAMPTDVSTASWNTFQALPRLHDLMALQGDGGKRLWATEVGAPTGTAPIAVSEDLQAAITTDAITGMRTWSWAGPTFLYSVRDAGTTASDPEQNFGLLHADFSPKPAWTALQQLLSATAAPVAATTEAVSTVVPAGPTAPAVSTVVAPAPVAPVTVVAPAPRPARWLSRSHRGRLAGLRRR